MCKVNKLQIQESDHGRSGVEGKREKYKGV